MNRNDHGSNDQNRTYRERENLARKQADERDSRYAEPERMHSRERMRHDHDRYPDRDIHNRHRSYRAQQEDSDFQNEKDFSGHGPQGYQRSDARIEDEVCELLARDHYIDASEILVSVENGIVKLAGSVNQREDRVEAEMLAGSVIGVEDIQNDITVIRRGRTH